MRNEAIEAFLQAPRHAIVALDYDGTLAPIAADPEQAAPAPGAVDALVACSRVFGTVAIVTGRPALGPVRLAGLDCVAGLEHLTVLGHYGHERWTTFTGVTAPPEHPGVDAVRRELPLLLTGAAAGVRIEDKGLSMAVHTRGCAEPETALAQVTEIAAKLAVATGLELQHGRLVVELRPPGAADKGAALRALVAEKVATGVLFAGDDLVDLPAYHALAEFRAADRATVGVFVDNPEAPPEVRAAADIVLPDQAAMVAFLHELAGRARS